MAHTNTIHINVHNIWFSINIAHARTPADCRHERTRASYNLESVCVPGPDHANMTAGLVLFDLHNDLISIRAVRLFDADDDDSGEIGGRAASWQRGV